MATWCFWFAAFSLVAVHVRAYENSTLPCPEQCKCVTQHAFNCTSLHFLNNLSTSTLEAIQFLIVIQRELHYIDKNVEKLSNLKDLNLSDNRIDHLKHLNHLPRLTHLNISRNRIKHFTAEDLPKNIQSLDISHNLIQFLPDHLYKLKHFKRIYLAGNKMACFQFSKLTLGPLRKHKMEIIGDVQCHGSQESEGVARMEAVNDEYWDDLLLNDEPGGSGELEGSGNIIITINDGDFGHDNKIIETTTNDLQFEENGSGDEHEFNILVPVVSSTFEPDEEGTDETGSGRAAVFNSDAAAEKDVSLMDAKNNNLNTERKASNTGINEIYSDESKVDKSQSTGTVIFLGVFLICLVALLVYAIKKNKDRKRNASQNKQADVEKYAANVELLPKNKIIVDKQNGNSETSPLVNRQNGNTATTDKQDIQEEEFNTSAGDDVNQSPVELRNKPAVEEGAADSAAKTSGPDVQSVTVKATELPDSVLQTPVLVTRSKSSDGTHIVVTPNLNQRSSSGSN